MLGNAAIGVGVASDAWSRHLKAIQVTLESIQDLHRQYLAKGTAQAREEFLRRRAALFLTLDNQLKDFASTGAGLRRQSSIKRMLNISTRSFIRTGEIAGYADTVSGVAQASRLIKNGTYIGIGLGVISTGLEIKEACSMGREDLCQRAKYVEGAKLIGSVGIGSLTAYGGTIVATSTCAVALGITTGPLALGCAVIGGGVGGILGGKAGEAAGGALGVKIYEGGLL
jgi:hypothetical protein